MNRKYALSLIISLIMSLMPALATVTLPKIFSDNMVLQQKSDVPIWGKSSPDKDVIVKTSWNRKTYKTRSNKMGSWSVLIKTMKAGGPYSISISDGQSIELKNVLLGEVWICSGQSNMEMPVGGSGQVRNFEQEIERANYPRIRLFQVEKNTSDIPLNDLKGSNGSWKECTPKTIVDFSAVAFFYGRNLYESLNVPIGLINTSWGGTPAQAWTSSEVLRQIPGFTDEVNEVMTLSEEAQLKSFNQKDAEWKKSLLKSDFGYQDSVAIASTIDYNDEEWATMQLPNSWEDCGIKDFDGIVWFRKEIQIPNDWEFKELVLSLGNVDDNEITFYNGKMIGSTDGFYIDRIYRIPKELVKPGKAIITVRVTDNGGGGGMTGGREKMWIATKSDQSSLIRLDNKWKYKIAIDLNQIPIAPRNPINNPNKSTVLFNAMIHPLIPFTIKGCIWYQGESNADRSYQAIQYRDLFPSMIRDWRNYWKSDFPFYFVQLANYKTKRDYPQESNWALLREAQMKTLRLNNTGMAVIIDIGDEYNIHPKNKQDVGLRLALQARAKTYGEKIECSGPLYRSYTIEGNKIRIKFDHAKGLKAKDYGKIKGFSIAGGDHLFHWADATINGDEIVVSSPKVNFPVSVRYAWADNPDCNLYNQANLPASPFRTDDW